MILMPASYFPTFSMLVIASSVLSPVPSQLAGASRPASAQATDTAASPAPRCTAEVLELGELSVAQPKTVPFTVRNTGAGAVTVESIRGGCGCTTVSALPTGMIAPGGSITVDVTVDPGKQGGVELVKPLYVTFAGGRVESVEIKGRVRAVATLTPSTIEAFDAATASQRLLIESVQGQTFRVSSAAPSGVIALPQSPSPSGRFELPFNFEAWVKAGRPATLVVTTDLLGASEIVVPIRSSEVVMMFRLPAATGDEASRGDLEATQASILRRLDAAIAGEGRSSQFRMKLHRETGMLFVHGTVAEVDAVREAVRTLPASAGIRESHPTAGT
jgi:hypothetical protein